MRRKGIVGLVLLLATLLLVPVGAGAQAAPPATPTFTGEAVAVDGTVYEVEATVREIALEGDELVVSSLTYGLTNALTGETTSDAYQGALALDAGPGCSILFLDVQPIFLDLLGLQLQTSEIVLDLSAVAGAGNLLGNLLCVVTGLLDGPGVFIQFIQSIIAVINTILAGLG